MEINDPVNIVNKYFPRLSIHQKAQLRQLQGLYEHWNERINLISRKDIPHLYERHVLHSLAIFDHLPQQGCSGVADVGTGGGFPGIPLAITCPHLQFHLIDSIGKKIKALQAISEALGLSNVTLYSSRMEALSLPVDQVVCRAVAKTDQVLRWTRNLSSSDSINDIFLLKGGDLTTELEPIRSWKVQVISLCDQFEEAYFDSKALIHLQQE